jgi:anti-sigma B factor antagonist
METAIGVFPSRERAEEAIKELRQHVPEDSIAFLTRSEADAEKLGKEFGALVGGVAGASMVAALLVPGLGPVFALGAGAAALFGLADSGTRAAIGKAVFRTGQDPVPDPKSSEDAAFFRDVLKQGRSLIVVRTESQELATAASRVLDRLGLGLENRTPDKMHAGVRHVGIIAVVDVSGRITVGEGNVMLRDVVGKLIDEGRKKIILNLARVDYIDSSGLGELVKTHTTIRNQGGQLKLVSLNPRIKTLLEMTKLSAVFEIDPDEACAVRSLGGDSQAVA